MRKRAARACARAARHWARLLAVVVLERRLIGCAISRGHDLHDRARIVPGVREHVLPAIRSQPLDESWLVLVIFDIKQVTGARLEVPDARGDPSCDLRTIGCGLACGRVTLLARRKRQQAGA